MPSIADRSTARRGLGRRLLGSGLLDALSAPHGIDRYVEMVRPSWAVRDLRAEVVAVRRAARGSVTLTLRPNGNWRGFRAGQFVRVGIEIDGVRHTRCYSPAGSAHAHGTIELTVRAHGEGLVSRHLNRTAQPGTVVALSQAEGDFVLPTRRPDHLLLISGGSGITPLMSMLRTVCDEGHARPVTFIHYAPTRAEALYRPELKAIAARHPNVTVIRAFTQEPGAGEIDGHLDRAQLAALLPDGAHAVAETYVCGPPALIEATEEIWAADGCAERLHVESFLPPVFAVPAAGEAEGTIAFAHSGVSAANDGRPLLDQAEAAGLTPESGCRMGICHSCTCRKTSGAVRNVRTGEVSTAPDEDIQICISVAVGDVALEI